MKRSKGSHPVSDVRGHNDETSIFGSPTMDISFRWWTMSKENVIFCLSHSFFSSDFRFLSYCIIGPLLKFSR